MKAEELIRDDADCCPSLIRKIEECWQPHDFRYIIKRCRSSLKPYKYLTIVISRIDVVIDFKARIDSTETLIEIREEVELFLKINLKREKNILERNNTQNNSSYIIGQKINELCTTKKKKILPLEQREITEKQLTIQIFNETKQDKAETARRLGISKGRLVQRLIKYGAYP